jgi:hypothetical protein
LFSTTLADDNNIRSIVGLATITLILVIGMQRVPAFGQSTSNFVLTVNTQYSNGQSLSGLWTTLTQNGQVVASGFSPVQFTLVSGQQYVVAVSDYQTTVFDHWQDTGSTSASRTISITQNTAITALYKSASGSFPVTQMSDTTVTFGSLTYIGRQINAEYATPSSQLVGKSIDSITLQLQKVGSPPGTFQVGVFNTDGTPKKSFEIRDISTLSSTLQDYEFRLSNSELYIIQAGDRIGIKYNGGSSSSGVSVMIDRNLADPFDGTNSYRTRYESSWLADNGEDMYMILKQTHASANSAPTAANKSVSTNENNPIAIALSGSDPDGQPVKFYIVKPPSHGILGIVNQSTRTVNYTPYDYVDGSDSFTFVASDGSLDSNVATVSINVVNTVAKTTSQAVIITVEQNGHDVTGMHTWLYHNNVLMNEGFSHVAFDVNNGQQYAISIDNFQDYIFDHWADTGSTNPARTFSISQDTPFYAVYKIAKLTVKSQDSAGHRLDGFWTTIAENGQVTQTGFTPVQFQLVSGRQYVVSVSNYGQWVFDHWLDNGSTNPNRTISITQATTLTATYRSAP